MRKSSLVAIFSSLLLGSAMAQPQSTTDTSSDKQPSPQATPTTPASDARKPGPDDTGNPEVGTKPSNVDKPATSGSYYPYSAGTAGDDPAKPKSTSVSPSAAAGVPDEGPPVPTDRWMEYDVDGDDHLSRAELTKAAPSLAPGFDKIDVNGDGKLTRDELRAWQASHEARSKEAAASRKESPLATTPRDTPPPAEPPRQ